MDVVVTHEINSGSDSTSSPSSSSSAPGNPDSTTHSDINKDPALVTNSEPQTLPTPRRGQRNKQKRLCQRGAAADDYANDASGSETESDGTADVIYDGKKNSSIS